ncbi:DsbA family oxidoreductase [Brachybacterium sp. DNPG3]
MSDATDLPVEASPAGEPLFTIDVWTDVVCPWCYIGEARLHDALAAEGLTDRVRVRAHSFELDPTAPVGAGRSNVDHLVEAKGIPAEQVREMEAQIGQMAAELGRGFVAERPMASTRAVHRTMQAVGAELGSDAATQFFLSLQRDYFTGTADPFDADTVIARAVAAGLPEDTARAAHEGTGEVGAASEQAVSAEVGEAAQMGARGVPFFLFDDRYTAPGALPLETFRQALRQIADEAGARG